MILAEKKHILIAQLNHLLTLAEDAPALRSRIEAEIRKLDEERFHLVVLGQFKRGKTTLINALLGEPLLPVGVVPLTSVLTLLRYGEKRRVSVIFLNGDRREVEPRALPDFVTERGNPHNEKQVRYVDIEYPSEFLHEGLVLIDTPGIGSLFLHNTETTYHFIPHIDAAIVVLSADPPITKTEFDFLKDVLQSVGKVFFVFNKVDTLDEQDALEAINYNAQVLNRHLSDGGAVLYPVSAVQALEAKQQRMGALLAPSGLPEVERAIRSFLQNEKGATLLQATLRRMEGFVSELRFVGELTLKANTIPLGDLDAKITKFERLVEFLEKDRKQFRFLLNGEVSALEQWIEEELESFAARERQHLIGVVDREIARWRGRASSALREKVERAIAQHLIAAFENWRTGHEAQIIERYQQITGEYVRKVNSFIQSVLEHSAELFDLEVKPFAELEPLAWKKTFYYKVDDDPVFLEIDFSKLSGALLPNALKRKRLRRKLEEGIGEKVMRNCGRLRYEYVYSIHEAQRSFETELEGKIDEAIATVHTVLSRTVRCRKDSEASVREEVARVQRRLSELDHFFRSVRNDEILT